MARRKFVRNSCAILTGSALHRYAMFATYAKSKLAQVATTFELQRREAAARSGVRAVALHPGNSYTDVIRDYPLPVRIANAAIAPIWAMVTQSAADSALTSLYAVATPHPDATAGQYLERCAPVAPAKEAANEAVARRVWAMSEELVRPWA